MNLTNAATDTWAVVGPTASGKTELGLRLAREKGGEIVSVDSRQVYRFLSVGTAKPRGQWTQGLYSVDGVPYHLVDIWDPALPFTAADFIQLAQETIEEIRRRKKTPILVGGTGLYLKALMEGLAALPPANESLRAELRALAEKNGRAFLHSELARVDPQAAHQIPANNIQRVMRALEVYRLTGKPISAWHREHQDALKQSKEKTAFKIRVISLARDELQKRIEQRCAAMMESGLIEETERLLKNGYAPGCPGLTGLGYPRVIAYLRDEISKPDLLASLIQDTRRYAKRQQTWFRNQLKGDVTPWNA